jgi:excisionase family DNA binding protein
MSDELYTVEAAAERLKLHAKTVLRFIREGRLRATKLGKSYRILRSDLDALAGAPARPAAAAESRATAIVDLSDVDPEMARRLASYVTGARLGREARPDPMNIDVAHDPMRRQVKVVLVGSLGDVAATLGLIQALLGA